nr:hypothetical protein CFP56_23752 [Quercus suber]
MVAEVIETILEALDLFQHTNFANFYPLIALILSHISVHDIFGNKELVSKDVLVHNQVEVFFSRMSLKKEKSGIIDVLAKTCVTEVGT